MMDNKRIVELLDAILLDLPLTPEQAPKMLDFSLNINKNIDGLQNSITKQQKETWEDVAVMKKEIESLQESCPHYICMTGKSPSGVTISDCYICGKTITGIKCRT